MNRERKFETADALDEADAIAAVEAVDLVLIGTNDLLADMGLPGEYAKGRRPHAKAGGHVQKPTAMQHDRAHGPREPSARSISPARLFPDYFATISAHQMQPFDTLTRPFWD